MRYFLCLIHTILFWIVAPNLCEAANQQLTVEYFTHQILTCTENDTSLPSNVIRTFWITNDGQLIDEKTSNADMPPRLQWVDKASAHMLNITKVDDAQFGYYICVMIKSNNETTIMRWGLNIDGPNYSELEEQYRKNAIIGAIAAAVMLVIVGGGCIIWHFRYSGRAGKDKDEEYDDRYGLKKHEPKYDNHSFDQTDIDTEKADDHRIIGHSGNAVLTIHENAQDNSGYENERM